MYKPGAGGGRGVTVKGENYISSKPGFIHSRIYDVKANGRQNNSFFPNSAKNGIQLVIVSLIESFFEE
ncbi:MAG: hypothetical protein H7Y03_01255 [Chitinophagaceae bacterium]|nr:hypothetical protein [Chitinophagaceae bacterium]